MSDHQHCVWSCGATDCPAPVKYSTPTDYKNLLDRPDSEWELSRAYNEVVIKWLEAEAKVRRLKLVPKSCSACKVAAALSAVGVALIIFSMLF